MTTDLMDVKATLTEGLTELHLPAVKRTYEEAARLAERETLRDLKLSRFVKKLAHFEGLIIDDLG